MLIEQTRGTRELERSTLGPLGPHLIDGAIISPEALHADDPPPSTPACRW